MKLPDSEPLALDEYWVIVDQWKQEWERGVQVPVNPDSLPEPSVTVTHCHNSKYQQDFKLYVKIVILLRLSYAFHLFLDRKISMFV